LFINHAWFVNICFGNFSVLWRWWQLWLLVMGGSHPLTPIRITSTTSTTSSSTNCSSAWTKHLLPQIVPPTTSAALVRLALVNATLRWEFGLLFLHLYHHHRGTTCRLVVLRHRLLALLLVLVQLVFECNPVSKFPKAC
jgi:hypothetical protein